ncbi:hypothetical protein KAJ02_06860 [Candidatus Bipolaricaulota bacterium]|nr:hypothetical protein [Candidatus Bipolaricaulota bacterium]
MKLAKSIATILLLLFVGATVGTLIAQEVARLKTQGAETGESEMRDETNVSAVSETSTGESVTDLPETAGHDEPGVSEVDASDGIGEVPVLASSSTDAPCVIEAVYFHNTRRCITCLNIESEAKAIVEAKFAKELTAGKLRWSAIDMEEERAYISRYDLAMPSLVLIRKIGNEVVDWITLDRTWSLIRSKTRFPEYIVDSFQAFLGECP